MLEINPLSDWQICFLMLWALLLFVEGFFCSAEDFYFHAVLFVYFLLSFHYPRSSIGKDIAKTYE